MFSIVLVLLTPFPNFIWTSNCSFLKKKAFFCWYFQFYLHKRQKVPSNIMQTETHVRCKTIQCFCISCHNSLFISGFISLKTVFLFVYNLVQFVGFSWIFVNMSVRLVRFGEGMDISPDSLISPNTKALEDLMSLLFQILCMTHFTPYQTWCSSARSWHQLRSSTLPSV